MPLSNGLRVVDDDRAAETEGAAQLSADAHPLLIDELEVAIAKKDMRRQADIMRRVTDLFMLHGAGYSAEHVAMFDDVMSRLVAAIESSARASFGEQLAKFSVVPPKTIRALVLDDAIEVAGPALRTVEGIDEDMLVECASTKSQDHLLAISARSSISEPVTDVLVELGNRQVVARVAANAGAQFSDLGCRKLADRATSDGELAQHVWSRHDIPRQHLLRLFAIASEAVRKELEAADRAKADLYRYMVAEAAIRIQSSARQSSKGFELARREVELLYCAGDLGKPKLLEYAETKEFDKTTIALSLLCDLPIGHIERIIAEEHLDQILVLAKAIDLSWETTRAILLMGTPVKADVRRKLEACHGSFLKLQPKTAKAAIQFYRLRARATAQV
jgi:uncharacterized protein (DUF2336 family)